MDKSVLPTTQEIQKFWEDGYYFSRRIFTDEELDAAILAQDAFYASPPVWPFSKRKPGGWKPGDDPRLRKNDYACLLVPQLRSIACHPMVGKIAAMLVGEKVRLWHDQLSYKAADDSSGFTTMGWHNDRGYWRACSAVNMVSAWIPFQATTKDSGPITFMRGSLKWEGNEGLDFFSTDLPGLEKRIVDHGHQRVAVPALLERGCVSFHHSLTIHCSGPNVSAKPRRALAVHMQPESNRAVEGHFHFNKLLGANGKEIDYQNPVFFPPLGEP
jgi:hypothetical protein